jgi:ATP synthase alpha/beta chain, C terminal domain
VSKQVTILQAATTGKLDDVPAGRIREFESGLYRFIETEHPEIFKTLDEKPELTGEITGAMNEAIDQFRRDAFGLEGAPPQKVTPASEGGKPGAGTQPEGTADAEATTAGEPEEEAQSAESEESSQGGENRPTA